MYLPSKREVCNHSPHYSADGESDLVLQYIAVTQGQKHIQFPKFCVLSEHEIMGKIQNSLLPRVL
jgi:hypothetical protein